jgi:3-hydroxyacyl-[acyl-carrier protein] dehydratase/trans-2-decenoyl-[acyl-carrier protein] isomerase
MTDRPTRIDYEGLLACARGEMFGLGNPQLPLPPMLMFDRITEISADSGPAGKGHVVAEFDVDPELWFFPCHFAGRSGDAGMPGPRRAMAADGFNLGWRGNDGARPGAGRGRGEVHRHGDAQGRVGRVPRQLHPRDRPQAQARIADGEMRADGELIYTSTDMKVGLFQE